MPRAAPHPLPDLLPVRTGRRRLAAAPAPMKTAATLTPPLPVLTGRGKGEGMKLSCYPSYDVARGTKKVGTVTSACPSPNCSGVARKRRISPT